MITHTELVHAREALLDRTVSFVAGQPDVVGILLAGSLPAGSADAYSDIDLLLHVLEQSYVGLDARDIERAVVALGGVLTAQIAEVHERFDLRRPRATDLAAVALVTKRQVA